MKRNLLTLVAMLLTLHSSVLYASIQSSTIGSLSMGDSIFSNEGNGGIDTEHYDLNIKWDNKTGVIDAVTTIDIRTTQKLSAFSLDFHALKINAVKVDGSISKKKSVKVSFMKKAIELILLQNNKESQTRLNPKSEQE